ncbi:MAG: hypothetical protein LBC68_00100 [Prevotellaceae bacterium]|nr:hypothetical protein [Prevotellaceae bacterium]
MRKITQKSEPSGENCGVGKSAATHYFVILSMLRPHTSTEPLRKKALAISELYGREECWIEDF